MPPHGTRRARAGPATSSASGLRWRVLVDPALGGARNMARDHALAAGLEHAEALLRVYRWEAPTVSFGRNEPARGLYDTESARRRGVGFVRRPTGGRAVLHDRELTYSVALPVRALGGARDAYRAVNAGIVAALRSLGVPAECADRGGAARPAAGPCFLSAAPGEVTVQGRKLVGSAQVRFGTALLQHGSLLLSPGQELLEEIGPGGAEVSGPPPTSLEEWMGELPSWDGLVDCLVRGLSAALGGCWSRGGAGGEPPSPELEALLLERYASPAWTWRR